MVEVPPPPSYRVEELIIAAFRAARDRGKPDWERMTLAVLKNRMVQLSRRGFDERRHGVATFRELIQQYSEIVRLDGHVAELVVGELPPRQPAAPESKQARIRPDLWRAVMDYTSGKSFVWDAVQGQAREAAPGETDNQLPTISAKELGEWRDAFVATQALTPQLVRWRDDAHATKELPRGLRGEWNGFVKRRVESRLRSWFDTRGLELPAIADEPAPEGVVRSSIDELRALVAGCVSVMTAEELAEIRLPPSVVLRARQKGKLP